MSPNHSFEQTAQRRRRWSPRGFGGCATRMLGHRRETPVELRELISTVLVELIQGVEDAQAQLKLSKATINPLGLKAQIALEKGDEPPSEPPRVSWRPVGWSQAGTACSVS